MTSPPLDYESVFGRRMRQRREELGISTRAFAEMMRANGYDWHHATVQRTESAKRPVRLNETVVIAHLLDAPLGLLLRPEADPADIDAIKTMIAAAEERADRADVDSRKARASEQKAREELEMAQIRWERAREEKDAAAKNMRREADRVIFLHEQLEGALRVVPAAAAYARTAREESEGDDQ